MAVNKLLLTIFILLVGLPLYADPSIGTVSGTITNGSAVIITGSNFGTKSTATPVQWDNFDAGTSGDTVAGKSPIVGGAWEEYVSSSAYLRYSTTQQRTGTGNAVLHNYTDISGAIRGLYRTYNGGSFYFTFWTYYDRTGSGWGDASFNYKPFDMLRAAGASVPSVYTGWGASSPSPSYRINIIDYDGANYTNPTGSTTGWYSGNYLGDYEDSWIRIEAWVDLGTFGEYDGCAQLWLHSASGIDQTHNLVNQRMRQYVNEVFTRIYFNEYYWRTGQPNAYIYTDDVYIDTTRSRVEIGNAPVWADCTHREIQIPSAWAVGEITATVNLGSFTTGTAYLFVVDSDGVASAGEEITLGESTPTAPTSVNVTIQNGRINTP